MSSRPLARACRAGVRATLAAVAALAIAACQGPAAPDDKSVALTDYDVEWDLAQALVRRMVAERERVRAWWGAGFPGPVRVGIYRMQPISMALIPAWRGDHGRMDLPARTVVRGSTPTLHEIVHIDIPNGNRFLAEGLAVYLQTHLGGVPAFPNFGADLHAAARSDVARADVTAMDATATPTRIESGSGLDRRGAYLVAGSFVRFLIETHGKERFRRLYALTPFRPGKRIAYSPDRYRPIYGSDLAALQREWKRVVRP